MSKLEMIVPVAKGISEKIEAQYLTDDIIQNSISNFNLFREKDVIVSASYEDNVWEMQNEKRTYYVKFIDKQFEVRKYVKDYTHFVSVLKVVAGLMIGTEAMESIRAVVSSIIKEVIGTKGFQNDYVDDERYSYSDSSVILRGINNFVLLFHGYSDRYYKYLKRRQNIVCEIDRQNYHSRKPVDLRDFPTYFKFDYIIEHFFRTCTRQERNLYFPLYLMWAITNIIPQRPTEFCIIRYDCVKYIDDHIYLDVRRSILKGAAPTFYTYKRDTDYIYDRYEINERISQLIEEYRGLTKNFGHPVEGLFSVEFLRKSRKECYGGHYKKDKVEEKPFIERDMNNLLNLFYDEVIVKQRGYKVITSECRVKGDVGNENDLWLEDDEIMKIRLKDTRHLAAINLILRGGSPMIISDLMGHSNVNMSCNYYENVSKLVKCKVKYFYDCMLRGDRNYLSKFSNVFRGVVLNNNAREQIVVDSGKCVSNQWSEGTWSDCVNAGFDCNRCICAALDGNKEIEKYSILLDEKLKFIREILSLEKSKAQLASIQQAIKEAQTHAHRLAEFYYKKLVEEYEAKKLYE